MSTTTTSVANSRCISILEFWHKVEFFIPFDLQRQVLEAEDAKWSVQRFSRPQLTTFDPGKLRQIRPPEGRKLSGFEIYLGVFDKAALSEVAQRVVHEALTPEEKYEQTERSELEGHTCFARIRLNALGEPLLEDVSVSTAPWALGRIETQGLTALDFDAFQADLASLKDDLKSFRAKRIVTDAEEASQSAIAQALTASELLELLDIFYKWAAYRPEPGAADAPVVVIRANSIGERAKAAVDKAGALSPQASEADTDDSDEEDAEPEDSAIDILNSFYAQDIARAIADFAQGRASSALQAYLTPVAAATRIDLYQPPGRERILAGLRPSRLNTGHWLDRPCHAMSLMQQFAINSVFEQLAQEGVFSVNGPPGTGKTTLLRDIFAENIVRRARALAKCETPGDAFLRDAVTVHFKGVETPCKIAVLREEIAGFEMVVASSNNAAVENISQDLPKTRSLGKAEKPDEPRWRDESGKATVRYLQQVAHNIAAKNSKGEYETLSADDEPWGLICCALGKKSNRTAFVNRLSSAGAKPPAKTPKNFDPDRHQSLWQWRSQYKGIGYAQARSAFQKADEAVQSLIGQLESHARLHAELQGQTEASFMAVAVQAEHGAQQTFNAAQHAVKAANEERKLCDDQLDTLRAQERLIEARRPQWLWWARLRKSAAYRNYSKELEVNQSQQATWLNRKITLQTSHPAKQDAMQSAASALAQAQEARSERASTWREKQDELARFATTFPQAACPPHGDELEKDRWQINGLWQDDTLNARRSELFAAALQLHEAWLAEVLQKGGRFGGNVVAFCHMLSGKRLQETQHALDLWRSLFMVVPVVSSTFASFASQFRDLGANALGWLFIDEAGQAVPQAAVGALWRAKRAVVVGDPLQIEPVFTVPIKLIEALSRSSRLPPDTDVAPHRVSVQNLADAANRLGARIGSEEGAQWIGSPLRVHRRCVDPMFSIANEIAYGGKMIFFDPSDQQKRRPPKDSLDLGDSAWVNAPGVADNKQAVSKQTELVHHAVMALYQRMGALPPVYIISPFKRVKDALIDRISKPENWTAVASAGTAPPKKSKLQEWCRARIGTVHTFQGKEEVIVWMVLGCDENMAGAANWAAGKPNLLNVALTRAKHRFFMIGDAGLWGGLPHFTAAGSEQLPRIFPEAFLQRMRAPVLSMTGTLLNGSDAPS